MPIAGCADRHLGRLKSMSSKTTRLDKIAQIYHALLKTYADPRPQAADPIDVLVSTILSQNTNDTLRDRAFDSLRQRFPSWEQVRDAPVAHIVDAIRVAGLAQTKGTRIKAALQYITAQHGSLNIDFLAERPRDEARAWLRAIEGVGAKTAAIVLLFALGQPAFPVDTHVYRVSTRLGLIPKTSLDKAHTLLEALIPPTWYMAYHLNLIQHGRRVCTARQPHCEICPLQVHCDYFHSLEPPGPGQH
jgi:endonuclease-3